jgi:invasion protein IalB
LREQNWASILADLAAIRVEPEASKRPPNRDRILKEIVVNLRKIWTPLTSRAFKPHPLLCVLTACLILAAATSAQAVDAPEGTVKSQHGDWQVVCKDPPAGSKNGVCALVQSVTAEDKNNIGLTVYFQKFSNGTRVLRVFAPLGVLLPPGLGLKIDDKDVGHAPFLRCHNFACYAQVVVDDPLVEQLKTGKTAIFIIFQTEEAGIGIPISLAGFGDALAALN